MDILFRLLDKQADKICEMKEVRLMLYLRTDFIVETIKEDGIENLFG